MSGEREAASRHSANIEFLRTEKVLAQLSAESKVLSAEHKVQRVKKVLVQQRAKSQEQRAESREQGAECLAQGTKHREPNGCRNYRSSARR